MVYGFNNAAIINPSTLLLPASSPDTVTVGTVTDSTADSTAQNHSSPKKSETTLTINRDQSPLPSEVHSPFVPVSHTDEADEADEAGGSCPPNRELSPLREGETPQRLRSPQLLEEPLERHTCVPCKQHFDHDNNLQVHLDLKHPCMSYRICEKTFACQDRFNRHFSKHSKNKREWKIIKATSSQNRVFTKISKNAAECQAGARRTNALEIY
jgi:hypothetical protein